MLIIIQWGIKRSVVRFTNSEKIFLMNNIDIVNFEENNAKALHEVENLIY